MTSRAAGEAVAAGRRAEAAARRYLEAAGLAIEAGNVRGGGGELDLVAMDGEVLVFVEVKSGGQAAAGGLRQRVDRRKRGRLIAAAEAYLAARPGPDPLCRFDVVTVRWQGEEARINHLPDAFRVGD